MRAKEADESCVFKCLDENSFSTVSMYAENRKIIKKKMFSKQNDYLLK